MVEVKKEQGFWVVYVNGEWAYASKGKLEAEKEAQKIRRGKQ